jgi:hypothetical protein
MNSTTFRIKTIVKLLSLTIALLGFVNQSVLAQGFCISDEMHRQAIERNPSLLQNQAALEQFTAQFVANQRMQRTSSTQTDPTVIIPVVVHVIHDNGPENISATSIIREIELLNRNFQRRGSDTGRVRNVLFRNIMGNANFEFRLARLDPNGRPTSGINRIQSPLTANARDNVKALSYWNSANYLNIWVVRSIESFGGDGTVLGFATFPSNNNMNQQGVVMIANTFGSNTLTHELGHFFNLQHPFVGQIAVDANCNAGVTDQVDDTPKTKGAFSNCDSARARCPGQPMPNTENYMDYASCSYMFTQGQVSRMQAAANSNTGSRRTLWSAANLNRTGVNYPRFKAIAIIGNPKSSICLSESITMQAGTFIDYADADVTYNWEIEGAAQTNITGPNPLISFNSPGFKRVKLVARNAIGADSMTIDSLFNVSGARTIGRTPYIQDFTNTNLLSPSVAGDSAWDFYSSGTQNFTFANVGIEGNTGKSLVLRPFNNGTGSNATLETHPILTRIDSTNEFISVHFYYAAARRTSNTSTTSDIVTVLASNDCGRTWTTVATINTPQVLYTTDRLSPSGVFIPNNQGEWKFFSSTRLPSALYRTSNLQFRINYNTIGTNTSTFYIDNFQLANRPVLSAKAKLTEAFDLNIAPNPSVGKSTISFTAQTVAPTTISVLDVAGRTIGSLEFNPEIGLNELSLSSVAKQLKAGVYTLRISNGSAIQVRKFVAAE